MRGSTEGFIGRVWRGAVGSHEMSRGPVPPGGPALDARSETGEGYFWVLIRAAMITGPPRLPLTTWTV